MNSDDKLYIVSGLHLKNPIGKKDCEIGTEIELMAKYLSEQENLEKLYTGHCTGMEAYSRLKKVLGEKVDRVITGKEILF